MASMTIRNLEDDIKARLRMQAAMNNRSMEDEARDILRTALAVTAEKPGNLLTSIRSRLEGPGGVELEIAPRQAIRPAPDFT